MSSRSGKISPLFIFFFGILLFILLFLFRHSPTPAPKPVTPTQAISERPTVQPVSPSPVLTTVLSEGSVTLVPVVRVVDGDTIVVMIDGKNTTIRLIGINTPETVDPRRGVECYGREASEKAREILTGRLIRLDPDPTQSERDRYNRLLRYVFLEDGTFFNQWMIEEGYAYEYTYSTPYQYQEEFQIAQEAAEEQQKGLWGSGACR